MCPPVVFIRNGERVAETDAVYPKLNLLGHAQLVEVFAGSQCGGHGVCGADRVRVESSHSGALSALSEDEIRHLDENEIKNGYRLACQCFPEFESPDLVIQVTVR